MENSVSRVVCGAPSSGVQEIYKENYINRLKSEDQERIFSYLKFSELGTVCLLDKRRNAVVSNSSLKTDSVYRDFAFSSKDWKRFCNKQVHTEGEESSFPLDIYARLNSPCPAFSGKRVGQTHMLVWIPKTVNYPDLKDGA